MMMPHPATAVATHDARIARSYDVVVAGASFAGLAVAQRLRGRRLALIDREALGEGVTSACAAPVSIVRAMGAEESIQRIHDRIVLHTPAATSSWDLPEPFCTFDYRRFCTAAFTHTDAEFVQEAVIGREGRTVRTASGALLAGGVLVDATGWRAALVGGPSSAYVNRRWMAFGIEAEVKCAFEPGLHFYFLPEVRDGYAWAFSAGAGVRFGVLSFLGRSKLGPALDTFMARFGLKPGSLHGGYLASGLRQAVVDGVFVVGDASGHCLPLTGEGIRTAALAGFRCGELIQQTLDGAISPAGAAIRYGRFIEPSRPKFRALLWANIALLGLPRSVVGTIAALVSRPRFLRRFMTPYLGIFDRVDGRALRNPLPVNPGPL
jgi:flavin-dependent dehydrogenase